MSKNIFIPYVSLIAGIFFSCFAIYYLWIGNTIYFYFYLSIFVGVVLNFTYFWYTKKESPALYFLASLGLPVLLPWQISGGVGGTGIYWHYIYIVWLFFLLGKARGFEWVCIVFSLSFTEFLLQQFGYISNPYRVGAMIIFYFGYILQTAFIYVYQTSKENVETDLKKQSEMLIVQSIELKKQIVQRAQSEEALKVRAEETGKTKIAMLNILEDVEIEKEKYKKQSIETKKFALAVEGTSEHVVITDPEGLILYANPAVEKVTGFSCREIIGRKAGNIDLWGGLMGQEFYKKMWGVIKTDKKVFKGEFKNKRKSGEEYISSASISPILNDAGQVQFFVGIERDITKEKELEKLKDEFVSIASHELRTPMAAIKSIISMVLDGDYGIVNESLKQPLSDVSTSTERLIRLVNDMLNVSRIEAGRLKYSLVGASLPTIVEEIIGIFNPLIKEKKLSIIVGSIADNPVQIDIDKVKEIFVNLVGNAVKFTNTGKITITSKQIGDFINVYVSDDGIGIEEKYQEKLFGKFEQIKVDKDRPQGTGLGLYISKQMARNMGGDLWLEQSEFGHGSTFAFSVPLAGSAVALKCQKGNC